MLKSKQFPLKNCSVSVVIPSHKRADNLQHCLSAIRSGTSQPLEILVIDKSLDDKAKKVCDTFSAAYITCHGSITRALNKGIESAHGDIVAFTDDDATPDVDWVESIIRSFASNAGVGVVGGPAPLSQTETTDLSRTVSFEIPLISAIYNAIVLDGRRGKAIGYLARSGETTHFQRVPLSPIRVDYVQGCNMAVRRDVAIESGGFCTFLVGHSEYWEVDFCSKTRNQGFDVLFDPQVKVAHKVVQGAKRPFFDRCYNYVMFFLTNRKRANLCVLPFLANLVVKNAFYILFPLLDRKAFGRVRIMDVFMPSIGIILALNDHLRSGRRVRSKLLVSARIP